MSDDATDDVGHRGAERAVEERLDRGLRWRPRWLAPQGWTAFVGEIVVVIAGVLIALGAGELVTAWNWQRKVVQGEQQLAAELQRSYRPAMEQAVVEPCIQAQLAILSKRLMASGDTLEPAPVVESRIGDTVVVFPNRTYVDATWVALLDDGTLPHMASERRQRFASAYRQFARLEAMNPDGTRSRGRLLSLGLPLPLDAPTRAGLLGELGEQSVRSRFQSLLAIQGMRIVDDLGHTPDRASIDAYLDASVTVKHCRASGLPLADIESVMRDSGNFAPNP